MTKRTTIYYDGREYVVARTIDEVRAEIDAILDTGSPAWLTINHGRGELRVADVLVSAGVAIGLVDSSDPDDDSEE